MFTDYGHSAARPSIFASLLGALPYLRLAPRLAASRARLADLDDHMLADIGLTAAQARAESRLPAWNVPTNWRR